MQKETKEEYSRINLDEIYEFLKRFSLSDALFLIGTVNAAFKYGHKKLATEGVPENTQRWIRDVCADEKGRLSLMLNMTRMARFFLLSKSNEYKKEILDTGTKELQHALHLVSNLYDERVEPKTIKSKEELDKVFSRLLQWQFPLQEPRADLSARAHLLFRKLPKEIGSSYDIERGMQEAVGLTVFEFMAIGHSLGLMSNGVLKHNLTIEVDSLKGIVTREKVQKFIEVSSGTPEDYCRMVRGKDWQSSSPLFDIYALDPLNQIPMIKTTYGQHLEPGCWVVPQVSYLWQRMSSGVFYILADYERKKGEAEGATGRNAFRDSFGDVYKHYVGLQLNQGPKKEQLIDLDTFKHDGLKPDFALVREHKIILLEVKVSFMSAASRSVGDETKIKTEIGKDEGQFAKALNQLNSFEKAIMSGEIQDKRFSGKKEIIKVIVGYENFYLGNSYLIRAAEETFGAEATKNLQIFTLMDIDTCGTALANDGKVVEPMFEKVASKELKTWSVAMFLREHNKGIPDRNPLLNAAFTEFFLEYSGGKIPEEDFN